MAACIAAVTSCGGDSGTGLTAKPPAPLATIRFDRAADSVEVQRTSTVIPSFFDSTGSTVTPLSTSWTVADSTIASVSSAGAVTGLHKGATSITLSSGTVSASLPVVVLPPAVATIAFAKTSFTMTEGDTLTIAAPTVVDRTGAVVTGRVATYLSGSLNVGVTSAGLVTALTAGSGTITATLDTAHAILTFTILPASIGRINLIPGILDMGVGNSIATQASAYSLAGQQLRGRAFTYMVSNPSIASVTSTGTVSGLAPGSATLTIATGNDAINVPISVARLATAGFLIDLRFVGNVSQTVREAATEAAVRWEQVVSAPLIPYHVIVGAGDCGKGSPAVDTTETSMMIVIRADSIDGPGNTIGEGGPCVIRDDVPQLTALGTVIVDTADVVVLAQHGILVDMLTHEMGHILGIGTLWSGIPSYANLATGLGGANPVFVGRAARVASAQLGFTADSSLGVPIENTGGPGTRDAHWRGSVFGHELMTGTIHVGLNPLSLVTIEALADFGYTVVPEAADDFDILNATNPGAFAQSSLTIGPPMRETIRFPQFTVTRTGKLRPIPGAKPPATAQ